MSNERLTLEKALIVFNYIKEHPRENRNHVLREAGKLGVSNIQFNKAEDTLYDMGLIDEVKIPSGIGYVVDSEVMDPENILERRFEGLSEIQ